MEKEIKSVIESLAARFEAETAEQNKSKVDELLARKDLDWEDPDNIHVLYYFNENGFIDGLIRRVYPGLESTQYHKICFVYEQYGFLDVQIRKLVDLGQGCCADKTRWVISQYLKRCKGEIPDSYPEKMDDNHRYWQPDFSTINDWMEYCDVLYKMFYGGYTEAVSQAYKKLLEEKEVAQAEILENNKKVQEWSECIPVKIEKMIGERKINREIKSTWITICQVVSRLYSEVVKNTVTDEILEKTILDVIEESK